MNHFNTKIKEYIHEEIANIDWGAWVEEINAIRVILMSRYIWIISLCFVSLNDDVVDVVKYIELIKKPRIKSK